MTQTNSAKWLSVLNTCTRPKDQNWRHTSHIKKPRSKRLGVTHRDTSAQQQRMTRVFGWIRNELITPLPVVHQKCKWVMQFHRRRQEQSAQSLRAQLSYQMMTLPWEALENGLARTQFNRHWVQKYASITSIFAAAARPGRSHAPTVNEFGETDSKSPWPYIRSPAPEVSVTLI